METFKSVISFGRDKIWSGIRYVYYDINPSTLTGAIDVIVIEDQNGNFHCGPFHVRFGKMCTLKPADKIVDIHLNGRYLENLHMKLGPAGEAYFVEGVEMKQDDIDRNLEVSPFQSDDESETKGNERFSNSDLGARVLSADQINQENVTKKKRVRRGLRMKSESNIKNSNDESVSVKDPTYLSDNDEPVDNLDSKLRGGYNSDGAVDQIDKEKPDINMSWEWGNFPETKSGSTTKEGNYDYQEDFDENVNFTLNLSDNKIEATTEQEQHEVYLEDLVGNAMSEEIKQQYLYTSIPAGMCCSPVDKQLRDNTTNDAGYKSDENSYPVSITAPISPTYPAINELKLSLCGDINTSGKIKNEKFVQHLLSYEDFMKEPDEILKNKDLVILLNGKYYNWNVAAPIIMSIIAFQTELPVNTITNMKNLYMSRKQQRRTWFNWGRQAQEETDVSPVRSTSNLNPEKIDTENQKTIQIESPSLEQQDIEDSSKPTISSKKKQYIATDSFTSTNSHSKENQFSDDSLTGKIYLKKIRLSSEEVAALDLQEGRNDITFSMTTKYQGTTMCKAAIYRWKWYDKIVISDVDGTITKSDVLGHVLPILGRDWTQVGVAKLYNKIYANNYKFIYLSARAIGQSHLTRTFLEEITQNSSEKLPEGPILLSPTSLFQSLHREVIEKKPEYFKIQCLGDVKNLFPNPDSNPLYAGFGNRPNDVIAYKAVGIDPKRIFTVNPEGSLKNEYCQKWSTNYGSLSEVADYFFQYQFEPHHFISSPHLEHGLEDYSDVNYWTMPIDEAVIRDELNKGKDESSGPVIQTVDVVKVDVSLTNNNTSAIASSSSSPTPQAAIVTTSVITTESITETTSTAVID